MLVYFIAGVDPVPANETRTYVIKAILMAIVLPGALYYYMVHSYNLEKELEETDVFLLSCEEKIAEYKEQINNLRAEYKALAEQYDIAVAEADNISHKKVTCIQRRASQSDEKLSRREKLLIPLLLSAYTGKEHITEKEKEDLIRYLKEL